MGIQSWSEDVILVDLPHDLDGHDELRTVIDMVRDKGDCGVVIDFSDVDVVGSPSLARFLELRTLLHDYGNRLVFCNVAPATKGIFAIARLDEAFEFVADKFVALASLQMIG